MKKIKGNTLCTFYIKKSGGVNEIGEASTEWARYAEKYGIFDYSGGTTQRDYKVKIEDSTHIFLCNYFDMTKDESELRASILGTNYEVIKIDDVMNKNVQYEIYLKQLGE